jgi:hypothetical protein
MMTKGKSPSRSNEPATPDATVSTSRRTEAEAGEQDLDKVTGGLSDIVITKHTDTSTPTL